jgi:hypothetical protein
LGGAVRYDLWQIGHDTFISSGGENKKAVIAQMREDSRPFSLHMESLRKNAA